MVGNSSVSLRNSAGFGRILEVLTIENRNFTKFSVSISNVWFCIKAGLLILSMVEIVRRPDFLLYITKQDSSTSNSVGFAMEFSI